MESNNFTVAARMVCLLLLYSITPTASVSFYTNRAYIKNSSNFVGMCVCGGGGGRGGQLILLSLPLNTHLMQTYKRTLFKLIFSGLAQIIWNEFSLNMCILMPKR